MSTLIMRQQALLCDTDGCPSSFVPTGTHRNPNPGGRPIAAGGFLVDVVTTRDRAEAAGWVTHIRTGTDTWIDLCPACIETARREATS